MFYFKAFLRLDRPVLIDPVQVELDRRILFARPGPLDPAQVQTYALMRDQLNGREARSGRAVARVQSGFIPPAFVTLSRLLDEGVECVEADFQPPSQGPQDDDRRAPVEAHPTAESGENQIKLENAELEPAYVDRTVTYPDPATEQPLDIPSLGTVPLNTSVHSERQRARKNDVPWQKKRFVQGHKVSKTLSIQERKWVDDALLRLKVLMGRTGALVCVTMKPKHLDALGPVQRMQYWKPFVNKFRSYRKRRCEALKKGLSWWVVRCVWVRESDPDDDLGEHFHWILVCPTVEEADRFIEHVRDTDDYEGWGDNTHAMRIDTKERMVGGKLSSFSNYVLKAVHPRSRFADHTIGWQPSGALVGKRYFITKNLTDPEVIAQTEVGMATLKRMRDEKKLAALRRRAQEKAGEEGLYSYARPAPVQPAEAPMSSEEAGYMSQGSDGPVHRDAADGEDQDSDVAPRSAPADVPSTPAAPTPAAVEPPPIEPPIYSGPGSAGRAHREEASYREMDISFETQPVELAPGMPATVPRALDVPAAIGDGDVTPPTPVQTVFVTDPVAPAPAEATSATSSPKATLAPLAALGRSVARGAAAGVGWIVSRLGARPPAPAMRRPRAPLFHPSTIPAAGAFFGAPIPW